MTNWFDIDKQGLAKLFAGKSKVFILHELVANAWDTNSPVVNITFTKEPNSRHATVVVEDEHPEGFADLRHAYTMFAESAKKKDASVRGRFNFGEKIVLAMCSEASIATTTGEVSFDREGRHASKAKREKGSVFTGLVQMTTAEFLEARQDFFLVLPPKGIRTFFNGEEIPYRPVDAVAHVTLPTVIGDDDGVLRRSARKTDVLIYKVDVGEVGMVYEMGIPVVETGDSYHVNVMQKVPLTVERDNVSPDFLRKVRAAVADAMASEIKGDVAQESWVTDALSSPTISPEAVQKLITARFGEKAAVFDPSDREANNRLTSQGYTVVFGRSLPKEAWENIRAAGALQPSGVISPTPKPYSTDPNAPPVTVIPREDWNEGMNIVAEFAENMAREANGTSVTIRMVKAKGFAACYGKVTATHGHFDFNVASLGAAWFDKRSVTAVVDLVIHELAHHTESNHLSERYYKALTRLAGEVANLALTKPELFAKLSPVTFT